MTNPVWAGGWGWGVLVHLGSRDKCHGLGGLHTTVMVPPHSSGVWEFKVKVVADSVSGESQLPRSLRCGPTWRKRWEALQGLFPRSPIPSWPRHLRQASPLDASIPLGASEFETGTEIRTTARGVRRTYRWKDRFKDNSDKRWKARGGARMV